MSFLIWIRSRCECQRAEEIAMRLVGEPMTSQVNQLSRRGGLGRGGCSGVGFDEPQGISGSAVKDLAHPARLQTGVRQPAQLTANQHAPRGLRL